MILVTGGAGYIGSHCVKNLLDEGYEVAVVDNLFRGYKEVIEVLQKKYGENKLKFFKVDLLDRKAIDKVIEEVKPEGVIHFAAICLVSESMSNPLPYFEINVGGTLNLLEAMVRNKINNLIFLSTSTVYGENHYLPIDEKHPLLPVSVYGESKLMMEKLADWYNRIHGINYVIFRCFNVAGADRDGLIGDSKKPSQLLIQNAVRGALGIETFKLTCSKVNTRDGSPVRDYVNVEDLADAYLAGLKYLWNDGKNEVINLGTGKGDSVLEVVEKVKEVTGVDFSVDQGEARKGDIAELYADATKAEKLLGWKAKRSLKDTVESLAKWYRGHPNGWSY
ncbi:MAG: UDP-glucose 4-epimerase GalE [Candidatus Shapirobacteria bacterium]|jgi:UDP-glucose 4-epimerase